MLTKQKLKYLILLNFIWGTIGIYADWAWLMQIPSYLIPFTMICALYPPLLTVWYFLKYLGKNPPNWLTFWIVCGTISYGIMAQIYFPLLMSWRGITFHDVGSMFWVAVYGLQSIILIPHLKKVRYLDLFIVIAFLSTADYSHYFLKTFVDFIIPGYPLWLKETTGFLGVLVQCFTIIHFAFIKKVEQKTISTVLDSQTE